MPAPWPELALRRLARDARHAARAHAGARQARGGAGAARAAAPARRAAPDRARLGDRAAARRPTARARSSSRSTCTPTRRWSSTATGARCAIPLTPDRPVGEVTRERAGRRARGSRARWSSTSTPQETPWTTPLDEDEEHATYDTGRGRRLLRGRDAGRAGAGRAARALPRTLDAGQRLVGLVRPRGEPVLRQARRAARRTTSSRATRATPSRSRSAGGRAMRATRARRSSPTPSRARGVRERDARSRPRRTGTPSSASTSSTGTTSATSPTPTRPRSSSRAPPCCTPARCAAGTRRSPPAPRAFRRPSSEA